MKFCLILSIVLLLAMFTEGILEYTFKCEEGHNASEPQIRCSSSNDELFLSCEEDSVVVATVCLGQVAPSSGHDCQHSEDNCLQPYELVNYGEALKLGDQISKCLWKESQCSLLVGNNAHKWKHDQIDCSHEEQFNYLAAFHFECISKSIIFEMCDHIEIITDPPHYGYIMTPSFPGKISSWLGLCEKRFNFTKSFYYNFTIQYMDLDGYNLRDFMRIDTILSNGSIVHGPTFTNLVDDYQYYKTNGHGFRIYFQRETQSFVKGFLVSYSVSDGTAVILLSWSTLASATLLYFLNF